MKTTLFALVLAVAAGASAQQLAPEKLQVRQLPPYSPHWVWVNDIDGFGMDGKAFLLDADAGTMLGMVSGGAFHDILLLPADRRHFYTTDTFFARGTRGERTDVLSIHDAATLAPAGEIVLPPKQLLSVTSLGASALLDDGRFAVVYNFTPTQSVTIADTTERKVAAEIETPGCALVYPAGARRFLMLCANGSMLDVQLDDAGKLKAKRETAKLHDPVKDLLHEDAVRIGGVWYFTSFLGDIYAADTTATKVRFEKPWPLQGKAERAGWRPGGYQLIAAHPASHRLAVLMHEGGAATHKNPGTEVWVYDATTRRRLTRAPLEHPATSIAFSRDAKPLMYTVNIEHGRLDVYDGTSYRYLRSIDQLGASPTAIQVP